MKSWKTTLGGILGAVGLAMRHDPRLAPYSDTVTAIGVLLVGSSARDNNVTSEQAGAKPAENKPPTP